MVKWAKKNNVVVPKNRNAFKTAFLRSLEYLALPNVSGNRNGPRGWYITGLVVSKVKGEAIPLPIVREIAVLSKVSVFEYRVQGGAINSRRPRSGKSFTYRDLNKNDERLTLDDIKR